MPRPAPLMAVPAIAHLLGWAVVALRCSMLTHLRCSGSALARRVAQKPPYVGLRELMLAFATLRLAGSVARASGGPEVPIPQVAGVDDRPRLRLS